MEMKLHLIIICKQKEFRIKKITCISLKMRSALVDVGKRKSLLAVANKTGLTRECNSQTILGAKEWMSPFQESYFLFTHGLGTPNESFYHQNSKLLGLGRQFEQMKFWAFGVFLANLSAPFLVLRVPCPCFPLINHYFYKKTRLLYPNYKYLFGIGI